MGIKLYSHPHLHPECSTILALMLLPTKALMMNGKEVIDETMPR